MYVTLLFSPLCSTDLLRAGTGRDGTRLPPRCLSLLRLRPCRDGPRQAAPGCVGPRHPPRLSLPRLRLRRDGQRQAAPRRDGLRRAAPPASLLVLAAAAACVFLAAAGQSGGDSGGGATSGGICRRLPSPRRLRPPLPRLLALPGQGLLFDSKDGRRCTRKKRCRQERFSQCQVQAPFVVPHGDRDGEEVGDVPLNRMKGGALAANASSPEALGMAVLTWFQAQGKRIFIFLFPFSGASSAVYKRWIPNTNFENTSNWDHGRVPCATDVILFGSNKVVSVFVQSSHSLTDMFIPLNGEFIMAPGAGFAAFEGSYNPGCETASKVTFTSADNYQWYDPTLWQAATSWDNLDQGKSIFTVDEERVPCQYDDVIFRPETSFRVNIESPEQMIQLRSISITGQKFTSDSALAEYMQSSSAKLQFHGQGTFQLLNTRCPDKSGCECGNAAVRDRICAALLQNSGNQCPAAVCKDPLKPIGHCCEICGATISLKYSDGFDIELYRDRILHTFLSLPKNAGVQVAISKVHEPQTFLGIVPRSSISFIQIVLVDNRTGSQIGTRAEQLAKDIMRDIAEHGESFSIVAGILQAATGSNWSTQGAGSPAGSVIAVTVVSLLLILLLLGIGLLLYRKGTLRSLPSVHFTSLWNRKRDVEPAGETSEKGFDNPIFDTPSNPVAFAGVCSVEEALEEMASKNSQLYYINPLYDETELSA
ncbi:protein amnionless [Elgaria multicarinata webbii]|uniref:protein amnionless n=1 Tax=Elgaria multicarinata webbii TaxID=159646 RepID=UPI002FCD3028